LDKLILLVDDEASVREALTDILNDGGYRVECAASGGEGLEKIETLNPDVVLLDIRMPDIDGIKVLELVCIMYMDKRMVTARRRDTRPRMRLPKLLRVPLIKVASLLNIEARFLHNRYSVA